MSARRASSATCGRSSAAPSEQLHPTISGRARSIERQNASTVCPERVRPDRSTNSEIQSGRSGATSWAAATAAFAFSVSKIVSISSRSTPPSASAAICSAYDALTRSKVTARKGRVVDLG